MRKLWWAQALWRKCKKITSYTQGCEEGGEIPNVVVGKSLSEESVCLCDSKKPASPGSGRKSFRALGAAGAKALGQKHAHRRPLWLENESRVESGWKQSCRGQKGSLVGSCGVGQGAWRLFKIQWESLEDLERGAPWPGLHSIPHPRCCTGHAL